MRLRRSRATRVALAALAAVTTLGAATGGGSLALAAVAEPHPESQLMAAVDDLNAGRLNEAWAGLDKLVKRQPNFRLARMFYREVQAAREGQPAPDLLASNDPDLQGLAEEARVRLAQWHETLPDNATPDLVLQLSRRHKHAVLVDLPRARLYLLENQDGKLKVLKSYYAASGKGGWGKKASGDNRTPVGIYRIAGFKGDNQLPELYGAGAFPTNYPNLWDQRLHLTGSGIWLHGVPRDTYARVPRSSEGCVTLANADLLELKPYFVAGETPVIFTDTLAWRPREDLYKMRSEFLEQVEGWRARWSARDTEGYLAYYADDFETGGMKKSAFSTYKRKVNAGKKRIDVRLEGVDLFRYPGDDGLWLARFIQDYRSDNYVKTSDKDQFWRRMPDGRWRIVKEASR